MNIPKIQRAPRERDEIESAFKKFSEDLKHALIIHGSTEFFVRRIPKKDWGQIEFDGFGQRVNGVLNIKYTVDAQYPYWSPIDIQAYTRYVQGKAQERDKDLLAKQILFLLYTVRNNTFHGGKRADDANDRQVIEKALPLLTMIVEFFLFGGLGRKQERSAVSQWHGTDARRGAPFDPGSTELGN